MKTLKLFVLAIFVLILPNMVLAQNSMKPSLISELQVYKVITTEEGDAKLIDAKEVKPGDTVEYHLTYRNQGEETFFALKPTLPVPEILAVSEKQDEADYMLWASLNGEQFSPFPIQEKSDQNDTPQNVDGSAYQQLQWDVEKLEPGSQIVLVARMKVLKN